MPFHEPDSLRYYTFQSLDDAGVVHGVFTRRGGVSPSPWKTLNLGGTVGDEPNRVGENRRRVFAALGVNIETIYDVWQVHSADVVCADRPRPPETPHLKADAILTDQPGVRLFMRFADCVPILLYDPARQVVGLVHAGWMGTIQKIIRLAVDKMRDKYRSDPGDILAAIGPSIGPDHYTIGPDVEAQVQRAFGPRAKDLLRKPESEVKFDLWTANRLILEEAGVSRVEISGLCTACHLEDWFSHRAEHGQTGRFGAVIGLPGSVRGRE